MIRLAKAVSAAALLGSLSLPTMAADLRIATPQLPAALDPVVSTLGTNWLVAANACEGLYALDDNWQPQLMLAQSAAYDEAALTLTIKLRQGIKFHSGAPLAADDVVASLSRYRESAGTGAVLKALVASIVATAPDTVVLKLNAPTGVIPGLLTLTPASIMSKASVEGKSPSQPVANLDCTGPFKVTEFQPDRQAVLARFADYQPRGEPSSGAAGEKKALADRVIFLPQPEPSVRRDSVLTGAADIATTLPFDFYDAVKSSPAAVPLIVKDNQSLTMVFNTRKGPTANPKLRQAIYAALDMDPIMLAAEGNPDFYTLDPSWAPDRNSVWHTGAGAEKFGTANPERAKKLLAESGYKGETLRWLTSKDFYQQHYLPALTAQQQLEDYGIKIDLQVMPAAAFVQTRTDPDKFDIFSSFLPTYVDPVVIPYLNASYPGFWNDPRKEELVKKLATSTDRKARIDIWKQIQTLIYEETPYIKFGTEASFEALRKGVTGVTDSPAIGQAFFNVAPPTK
ncbi:ABC transporter substrate-binding protein [Methylocapsa sp. S129]|uniref:ABC transporter substrate-binding protein n=1 Tax=Methylocapsa sp. S129 TaxID=1641869 RepID=UPI00131BE9C6|nr:ABC transporter substrate-binding protein [Methylocapsa sp. S129]